MSWAVLAQCMEPLHPGCIGHWDTADSPTRGSTGCRRRALVHSEIMNQRIKKTGCQGHVLEEDEKRGIGYSLYSVRGQKVLFPHGWN